MGAWCQSPRQFDVEVEALKGERARSECAQAELREAWTAHQAGVARAKSGAPADTPRRKGTAAGLTGELDLLCTSLRDRIQILQRAMRGSVGWASLHHRDDPMTDA
ncbi:MAG TPA: hypothetical protein EYQ74_06985 [Planctomycetes bacterium]|nr:hypothetical protein [Planctomycetota bacterium]HIK59492.1 hypothetical protein [Planctomycetota bacterium]